MLQDTSNPLRALRILQSLGEAIPHAGGIIRAIAGIGIVILETADRVRVNREECKDIARRVAEHIEVLRVLGVNEDGDLDLADDVKLRLQNYLTVLKNVSKTVERLGTDSSSNRLGLPKSSVQEETKDCINKLNEAYQLYIFQFSISADTKLSTLINCMRALSLQLDTHSQTQSLVYTPHDPDANQPDAIRRIPSTNLTITSSLSRIQKKEYILYIESGYLLDRFGERTAVIARKFMSLPTCTTNDGGGGNKRKGKQKAVDEDVDEMRGWKAFDAEIELRRNLLNIHFARLLGISLPSSRTKIIILSASTGTGAAAGQGAVIAYDYLRGLPGLEYLHEHIRIVRPLLLRDMCEFAVRVSNLSVYISIKIEV
ncbi:hypothetical protein SISNIDRAFT_461262 [Sistotremastrum niveocremeum HHB9708]|uniref:Uncharacterized protein n=1 Tax=Sistotremastrum niveocremeum HHB9708 TaxID=1314777 RepID=A0A164MU61_9AGAM|nr:hypothetical protein SISNIDRAFT_461262 [Sistotremastrum niveocremeum HHB9708]